MVGIILGTRVAQHEAATMALFHPFYHKPTKGVAHCWGGGGGWGGWMMAALLRRDILEC